MFIVIFFNSSFLLFYFTQYWNSTTSSLSLYYLYFLSLFVLKKNLIFYLNSNKWKLCSSNCTHFFLTFTLSPTFLILFTFSFPQTFHLDITLPLSFYLPLFCFFLLSSSYYKFVIHSSILYIIFSHKKVVISHSFSLNFLVDFYFYFSCISILVW